MATTTRPRVRAAPCYVALGLRPEMIDEFQEQVEEEGAQLVSIDHDDEGTAVVFFALAAGDEGMWLRALTGRFGCGLAPAPRRTRVEGQSPASV